MLESLNQALMISLHCFLLVYSQLLLIENSSLSLNHVLKHSELHLGIDVGSLRLG